MRDLQLGDDHDARDLNLQVEHQVAPPARRRRAVEALLGTHDAQPARAVLTSDVGHEGVVAKGAQQPRDVAHLVDGHHHAHAVAHACDAPVALGTQRHLLRDALHLLEVLGLDARDRAEAVLPLGRRDDGRHHAPKGRQHLGVLAHVLGNVPLVAHARLLHRRRQQRAAVGLKALGHGVAVFEDALALHVLRTRDAGLVDQLPHGRVHVAEAVAALHDRRRCQTEQAGLLQALGDRLLVRAPEREVRRAKGRDGVRIVGRRLELALPLLDGRAVHRRAHRVRICQRLECTQRRPQLGEVRLLVNGHTLGREHPVDLIGGQLALERGCDGGFDDLAEGGRASQPRTLDRPHDRPRAAELPHLPPQLCGFVLARGERRLGVAPPGEGVVELAPRHAIARLALVRPLPELRQLSFSHFRAAAGGVQLLADGLERFHEMQIVALEGVRGGVEALDCRRARREWHLARTVGSLLNEGGQVHGWCRSANNGCCMRL